MQMSSEIEELIENEWYIVRYSGEIPEIAYNSAVYFLTGSAKGPGITLTAEQVETLKQAAVARYKEIVLRDLDHANIGKSIYRGVSRSICNYHRFHRFCERQHLDPSDVRICAAAALRNFLEAECWLTGTADAQSAINCTFAELRNYAAELGIAFDPVFAGLRTICRKEE